MKRFFERRLHSVALEYFHAAALRLDSLWRVFTINVPRLTALRRSYSLASLAAAASLITSTAQNFSGSKAGAEREIGGIRFCWCPPGRFKMGSPSSELDHRLDEAQVDVILTKGFWMGKYEVTQGQWQRVVGNFPGERTEIAGVGDDFPVYWVNFEEAEQFCQRLTELAHRSRELPADWTFQIPTEAQWEYACRAGTATATSFGDTLNRHQANFAGAPYGVPEGPEASPILKRASKVGSYPANPWGLHDMHGNEFEWTRDWYHSKLPGGTDPELSSIKGDRNRDGTYSRARRGGSWGDDGRWCRCALRLRYEPNRGADHIGFRISAVQQPTSNR